MAPNLPGEKIPPGGGNFGGSFQKGAFVNTIGPKAGSKRAEVKELNSHAKSHDAMMASVVRFHVHKEMAKPSRLRAAFDHHSANPQQAPGWESRAQAMIKASASAPVLAREGTSSSSIAEAAAAILASGSAPASPTTTQEVTPAMLNARFYPHPCLTRGMLKLSGGRARDWGVDLESAPGYRCPFYDGHADRFSALKDQPGVEPRLPARSQRWFSDDEWSNPAHHAAYKVTHTAPPQEAYSRP
jgi:hypothetical protein